jgi:hypothetical protein
MDAIIHAKELADEIFEMTKRLVLTGETEKEETEIEAYVTLLEEREPLVDELSDLRQQLSDEELSSPQFEEIAKIVSAITEMDKAHLRFVEHKHKKVQASYKEVKQGQRLNAGYNPVQVDTISSKFDMKQ